MQTRPIPRSGEPLPVVGCGTWQAFDIGPDAGARDRLATVLDTLAEGGGRVIDSSPMYGAAEAVVGMLRGAHYSAPPAFLATKVWTRGRDAGLRQMRESMRLLGCERLDLMQVHNLLDWRSHLPSLLALREAGQLRYLGITHYSAAAHIEVETVLRAHPWDFLQIEYSLTDRAAADRLLPLAADLGVAVLINLPFGGGGLLQRLRAHPLPPWAAEYGGTSWAVLLLKYVLAQPAVTCVIPGSGNPLHMRENLAAGIGPVLAPRACKALEALAAQL